MAITKILKRREPMRELVRYVINPKKTEDQLLTASFNCSIDTAFRQMQQTKAQYSKLDGVQGYHIIQSFKPDEITPEIALELAQKFVETYLKDYEVVVATHVDKAHIHNHIVFNSVSDTTGKKYRNTLTNYYQKIRVISDDLCRKYGLSVILNPKRGGHSYFEWKLHKAGLCTYRELLDRDIREALGVALDIGNFYELMEERGYRVGMENGFPTFLPDGAKHPFRAKMNGHSLSEEQLRSILETEFHLTAPEVIKEKEFVPYKAYGKQHGFRALYVSWMYVLGIIGRGGRVPYPKVSYRDTMQFERYKVQQDFLNENAIDTKEQLLEKKESLKEKLEMLTKERDDLNSQKLRQKGVFHALSTLRYYEGIEELYKEGAQGMEKDYKKYQKAKAALTGRNLDEIQTKKEQLYKDLSDRNSQIRTLRSKIRLCDEIGLTVPKIDEKLTEEKGKESAAPVRTE